MYDSWNEDEQLAALLDGRLDADMRTEMLSRLTKDDETYEVFTSLAAILREVEEEDLRADVAAPSVVPLRTREARRSAMKRRWMVAAALAGVALAPELPPEVRRSGASDPILLAGRSEPASNGLPANWNQPPTSASSR